MTEQPKRSLISTSARYVAGELKVNVESYFHTDFSQGEKLAMIDRMIESASMMREAIASDDFAELGGIVGVR